MHVVIDDTFRYVDDTFAVFNNEEDCNTFFIHLNSLHPSLLFTYEKESNHSLPFLDVLVERHDSEFLTSVYRKPTFTGQYLRWNSFSLQKRKINLIGTLVHRAFMICSKSKLDKELGKIHSILLENGYPERVINSAFKRKLQQLNSNPVHTVKKVPCLPTHPMDWKCFDEVRKADYVCCEMLLFLRRTTCYFQHPTAPSSD